MENSVPYHCPKCRSGGEQAVFVSLPELRQHIMKVHFNQAPATNTSLPLDTNLPKGNIPLLTTPLMKDIRNVQAFTEQEQLAQAKKYLLREAMKSTDQNREQIRKLNEEIKIKESSLDTAIKKLSTLSEKNQNIEDEYGRMEMNNRQIRNELEELKSKLMEKEKILEEKNKELADQLNYMKSIEEKEAVAKEKLEKTVEKIIERAETAEKNLEMLKLSTANSNPVVTQSRSRDLPREVEPTKTNDEIQAILESSNSASNAAYKQASSNDPDFLSKMANDSRQNANPLVQVYLKNFLDKYNELKARDYAFDQAMPMYSSVPQVQINSYDLDRSQNDGNARQRLIRPERDQKYDEDGISSSRDKPNNVNNNNNYYRDQYSLNSKSSLSPMSKNLHNEKKSPVWTNYDADDDDEPLTEISDEEVEHIQSTVNTAVRR